MTAVQPTGALFDVVLLCHVAAALAALGTVAASGVAAARVLRPRGGTPAPGALRYFAPGVNWAGRTIHAVPLLGLALIALSRGAYDLDDPWVLAGLGLWSVAAVCAEGILWPAERQVQMDLLAVPAPAVASAPVAPADPTGGAGSRYPAPPGAAVTRRACARVCVSAVVVDAALIAAMVVMVVRP